MICPSPAALRSKTYGFTLIELLITLLILGILVTIAVPVSHDFLISHRSNAQVNMLARALYFARSEAIIRGEKVTFCGSKNEKTCDGNWNKGQIVLGQNKEVLRIFSALPPSDYLVWNSSAGKDTFVEWLPTGYTNGQRGTFYYCTRPANNARTLVLLDTGRWYSASMDQASFNRFCYQ